MSTIAEAIRNVLVNDATVTAITGARIYPAVIPQNAASARCITYDQISTPRLRALDGLDGLSQPRFQINSWGTTYAEAKSLAAAVKGALADYSGTALGVVIRDVSIEDEGDVEDLSPDVRSRRRYGVRQDFLVWYEE